jgi:hypothetical protein
MRRNTGSSEESSPRRQGTTLGQGSRAVGQLTNHLDVARALQELSIDIPEPDPLHFLEERVHRDVQNWQPFFGCPLSSGSSGNNHLRRFGQNVEHDGENTHHNLSYQHVKHQDGVQYTHSCPCPMRTFRQAQYSYTVESHHFQSYPSPLHTTSIPFQMLPLTSPYPSSSQNFEGQNLQPISPQGLQVRNGSPPGWVYHSRQRQEPQEETPTSEDDSQEDQNRVQRDSEEDVQYQGYEKNWQPFPSEIRGEYPTFQGSKDNECQRIEEGGTTKVDEWLWRYPTSERDAMTGSTHDEESYHLFHFSDGQLTRGTHQRHSERDISVPNQAWQERVQKLGYSTFNQQNQLTESQGVQYGHAVQSMGTVLEDHVVNAHESDRQGNSVEENHSPMFSKHCSGCKCFRGCLDVSQGLSNEVTLREQQRQDDQNAEQPIPHLQTLHARNKVICPFGALPVKACSWKNELRDRRKHVVIAHHDDFEYCNKVILTPNTARILIAYDEMFLCYTYMDPTTNKLYCVTQYTSKTSGLNALYQYICKLRATCRYEMIKDTRLVSSMDETFLALMTSGRCVRFDSEVARSFMGDKIAVCFRITPRKEC